MSRSTNGAMSLDGICHATLAIPLTQRCSQISLAKTKQSKKKPQKVVWDFCQ